MTSKTLAPTHSYAVAAGAALLLLSLGYFGILAPYGLDLADEGHLLHQIYRTYLGQLPYVDFHTGYAPAVYYWNAAVFSLFGVNLVLLRLCLALVNGLSVWCLYWLARRVGGSVPAAIAAGLLYLAFMPYDEHFASFNIPYPAWYGTLFWLLSLMCVLSWWERAHAAWWVVAGLCAGAAFAFKQNGGLLQLAALSITACLMERPVWGDQGASGGLRGTLWRAEGVVRWLIPVGGTFAFMAMFGRAAGPREVQVFALPLFVVVLWQLLVPRARLARPVPPLTLWRDLVLLAAGFLVVTVPWALYFWWRLGTAGFLESVLYIGGGTNYQHFYFILYPEVRRLCIFFLIAGGTLVTIGQLMRRGWLPPRLVMAVSATVVLGVLWLASSPRFPMVEGLQKSVVTLMRLVSFPLVLAVEWAAIAVHVAQTARRKSSDPQIISDVLVMPADSLERDRLVQSSGTYLIVLVSAILMHAQLFPRSDFQHLIFSAPLVVVLGAELIGSLATLWGRGIAHRAAGRRAVRVVALIPVYAAVAIALAPALVRIEYMVRAAWKGDVTALVHLDSPYAPLVIEPASGRPFLSISSALHYVQAHTRPDDYVFTFPCLDGFGFLLDRRDPTRHGYYFPGSPGRAVEAEVIDALRDRRPPYIVTLHDHALFFVDSPVYYFNLRRYVMQHYHPVERLDMFDVLRRNDAAEPAATVAAGAADESTGAAKAGGDDAPANDLPDSIPLWRRELEHRHGATAQRVNAALAAMPQPNVESLAAALWTLDPAGERALAELVRSGRSPGGAAALATALEPHALPVGLREFFLQIIMESGDQQSTVPLLETLKNAESAQIDSLASGLLFIEFRVAMERYWYVPPKRSDDAAIDDLLPSAQAIKWIDNPSEMIGLRLLAIRMAGRDRDPRFKPSLVRLLGDANENPVLRIGAAQSLVDGGFGDELIPTIMAWLPEASALPPALVAQIYQHAPERSRPILVQSMRAANDTERTVAFWIAAGLQDPQLLDSLRTGLSDPLPEVQIAAVWGLGNLGGDAVLPELKRVSRDGSKDMAGFAERAIQRIVTAERVPVAQKN